MIQEMNRRDYIRSLDTLRDDVIEIGKRYANALLAGAKEIEKERQKKTGKLFCDLATRLFEDAAVTLKIVEADEAAGIGEQGLFDLREGDELPANDPPQEPPQEQTATAEKKDGKGKKPSKKGGAK